MDCPSEEQLIRMKLEEISGINDLRFDISQRILEVTHVNDASGILEALHKLNLGSSLLKTETVTDFNSDENADKQDRPLLWKVLYINAFFFILEGITGLYYRSVGLLSDGLDMLADCFVYGIAVWAIGKRKLLQKKLAHLSGYFQLALAGIGIAEVARRVFFADVMPDFSAMIVVSFMALIGNTWSLILLQRSTSKAPHIKASLIFTSNDILANIGVIVAAGAVHWTDSKYPDLIIGSIVFYLVTLGAIRILKL